MWRAPDARGAVVRAGDDPLALRVERRRQVEPPPFAPAPVLCRPALRLFVRAAGARRLAFSPRLPRSPERTRSVVQSAQEHPLADVRPTLWPPRCCLQREAETRCVP